MDGFDKVSTTNQMPSRTTRDILATFLHNVRWTREQSWGKSKIKRESISCRMELEIEAVNGDPVEVYRGNQVFKASLKREMSSFIREWIAHASRDSLPLRCSPSFFSLFCYFFFFFLISSRDDPNARLKSEATPAEALFPSQTGRATIPRSGDRPIDRERRERRNGANSKENVKSRIKDRRQVAKKKIGGEAKRGREKRRRVVAARG